MAIKLKKSDSSFKNLLFRLSPKPAKLVAMLLVCVLIGITAFDTMLIKSTSISSLSQSKYTESDDYHSTVMDMYERMCMTSSVYLRNIDENWNFQKTSYLLSDYLYYLDYNQYKYKKTDNGIIPVSDMFNFYVSFNDDGNVRYMTNISGDIMNSNSVSVDDKLEYLKSNFTNYLMRKNNQVTSDKISSSKINYYEYSNGESFNENDDEYIQETFADNLVPVGSWYYDNYERYFYYYGNAEAIRFYNFDKSAPENSDAYNGYKTIQEYDNANDDYSYYDTPIELLDDYKVTKGDDSGITVFISPKSEKINELSAAYTKEYKNYSIERTFFIVLTIVTSILMLYLLFVCGTSYTDEFGFEWKKTKFIGSIFTEIYFLIMFCSFVLRLAFFDVLPELTESFEHAFNNIIISGLMFGLIYAFLFTLGFGSLLQIVQKIKTKDLFNDSIIVKIIRKIISAYHNSQSYQNYQQLTIGEKLTKRDIKVLTACLIVGLSIVLSIMTGEYGLMLFVVIICAVVVGICEYRNIKDNKDLSTLSRQIKYLGTDENTEIITDECSSIYNDSKQLAQISDTVKNSVDEQIKSERMKIELVANVSHDLKTPLTSIISYIDLLKKSELNDEASSYVKILDNKSQKLKSIVNDVFSLAKATSGIEVNLVKLNFVMLFNQVLCDADDKIADSKKVIKTDISVDDAYVLADSEKLYRVFQNVIDNSINYSMDGTRIFFDIKKVGKNVIFTSSNVSSYTIEFTAEEIMERFVRGDKSRTDGGSGLGLSIAKSFTEACGGEFKVILDGDTFKSVISMPIIEKEEAPLIETTDE